MTSAAIDNFVASLGSPWQRSACESLLAAIRSADQPLSESLKWGNPYFSRHSAVLKWFVAKEWINVYFYRGHLMADPDGYFEPTENARMRTLRITEERTVPPSAFRELLGEAIRLDG